MVTKIADFNGDNEEVVLQWQVVECIRQTTIFAHAHLHETTKVTCYYSV